MFSASAQYYDLLYKFKDYAREAADIVALLQARQPGAKSILDVGCGTAEHLKYLPDSFEIEGLDLDPELLKLAQAKFPDRPFHCADMGKFDLGKKFDVVLCLFSSIGYVITQERLQATLACFAQHLQPSGIVVVEPWFSKEVFRPTSLSMLTHEQDDLKICRMSLTSVEGNLSVLDFQYMIGEKGKGIRLEKETHTLAMFEEGEFRNAFELAGMTVEFDPQGLTGRGLYIGRLG